MQVLKDGQDIYPVTSVVLMPLIQKKKKNHKIITKCFMLDRRYSFNSIAKVHEWKAKCYLCWRGH